MKKTATLLAIVGLALIFTTGAALAMKTAQVVSATQHNASGFAAALRK